MGSPEDLDKTISRAAERPAPKSSARAVLTAVHPHGVDWRFELSNESVTIGRSENDGVPALAHETVSRTHVQIAFDTTARRHVVTDLGSHNGSKINGAKLSANDSAVLEDNAIIEVGDVLLVFERGSGVTTQVPAEVALDRVPGAACKMNLVRALIARAAPDPSPILVIGETGTGKEWIAREVHRLSGRQGKLLAINCAALSPQLIESQLFGHVKGSFTGASADHRGFFVEAEGGTLFLDELGELPAELQPKLLRVLQEREVRPVGGTTTRTVDVRVIAATNRDLATEVREGRFRRDLFARLALWEVSLPPLRQRRVDILMWVEKLHKLWAAQREAGEIATPTFTAEAASTLLLYGWPDNLRGIDRLVHALSAASSDGGSIERDRLPGWVLAPADAEPSSPSAVTSPTVVKKPSSRSPAPGKEEFEAALESLGGNVSALAKHFGRDRRQIYRWLETYGLSDKRQGRKPD